MRGPTVHLFTTRIFKRTEEDINSKTLVSCSTITENNNNKMVSNGAEPMGFIT